MIANLIGGPEDGKRVIIEGFSKVYYVSERRDPTETPRGGTSFTEIMRSVYELDEVTIERPVKDFIYKGTL